MTSSFIGSASTGSVWERLVFQLGALSGEYLFFIGATLLALLLLSHRRWVGAALSFVLALLWLSFHLPVSLYLESLGADSFAETHNFDLDEARFWMQTLKEAIQPDFSLKKFAVYLAAALLGFHALRWLFHRRGWTGRLYVASKLTLVLAFIGLAFHQTTAKALAFYLENTEKFHATMANFDNPAPTPQLPAPAIDLVVYIGESTSVMNMGLYSYGRPTTPELSALAATDPRLLVFHNVFATHAHTSRSLLEALSMGLDPGQAFVPITERKRLSVVDLLIQGGLAPRLISNQGQGGSWDQASSVIFRHSQNTFRSRAKPAHAGQAMESPWDHEFFEDQLQKLQGQVAPAAGSQVLFLHSYAGHGPYLRNIPEHFRQPVDDTFKTLPREQLIADPLPSLEQVEGYDSAIRYVDFSLSRAIARVKQAQRPTVLVYFSDHGDAVYAGIGHDSARFRHEMARVPFLMYMNDAAQKARPELLPKYRHLAQARRTATLAQLPSTLLDVLGARLAPSAQTVLTLSSWLSPVHTLDGRPAPATGRNGERLLGKTDEDTRRYLAARSGQLSASAACRTARSFEERSRSAMVLHCQPSPWQVVRHGR